MIANFKTKLARIIDNVNDVDSKIVQEPNVFSEIELDSCDAIDLGLSLRKDFGISVDHLECVKRFNETVVFSDFSEYVATEVVRQHLQSIAPNSGVELNDETTLGNVGFGQRAVHALAADLEDFFNYDFCDIEGLSPNTTYGELIGFVKDKVSNEMVVDPDLGPSSLDLALATAKEEFGLTDDEAVSSKILYQHLGLDSFDRLKLLIVLSQKTGVDFKDVIIDEEADFVEVAGKMDEVKAALQLG